MYVCMYVYTDIFVNASIFENYCMVCAEAVHMGLPVISSKVGEIPKFCYADSSILVDMYVCMYICMYVCMFVYIMRIYT